MGLSVGGWKLMEVEGLGSSADGPSDSWSTVL